LGFLAALEPGLSGVLRERFLDQGHVSARQWEQYADRVVIVHDLLQADTLAEWIRSLRPEPDREEDEHELDEDDEDALTRELRAELKSRSAREVFADRLQREPRGQECEKLGEVNEPIRAEVWALPEDVDL
jgi:hypothetical protein